MFLFGFEISCPSLAKDGATNPCHCSGERQGLQCFLDAPSLWCQRRATGEYMCAKTIKCFTDGRTGQLGQSHHASSDMYLNAFIRQTSGIQSNRGRSVLLVRGVLTGISHVMVVAWSLHICINNLTLSCTCQRMCISPDRSTVPETFSQL